MELETIAARLRHLAASLSTSTPDPGRIVGQQLRSLLDEATAITDELLEAIEEVKLRGSKSSFKTFAHALQHMGRTRRSQSLVESLPECKDNSTPIYYHL